MPKKKKELAPPPVAKNLQAEGAASALNRLENAELVAYQEMQAAIKDGDPITVSEKRKNWLSLSESLRKFDLLVEENRRASGELVPRSELEHALENFLQASRVAFTSLKNSIVPSVANCGSDFGAIDKLLQKTYHEIWIGSCLLMLGASKKWTAPIVERAFHEAFGPDHKTQILAFYEQFLRERFASLNAEANA
jgi:hypothetical protein